MYFGRVLVQLVVITSLALMIIEHSNVLAQTPEKTFTTPKFGFSINYSSTWTIQKGDDDFSPGIYNGAMVAPGIAIVATLCPDSKLESELQFVDCYTNSPMQIEIIAFKLKNGTTLKEFFELNKSSIPRSIAINNIETKKMEIAGLPAYQVLDIINPDNDVTKSKFMSFNTVNGNIGYRIVMSNSDFDY